LNNIPSILVGCHLGKITGHDVETGACLFDYDSSYLGGIMSICVASDDSQIYAGHQRGEVSIIPFEVQTESQMQFGGFTLTVINMVDPGSQVVIEAHSKCVRLFRPLFNNEYLISVSTDSRVGIWSASTFENVITLRHHTKSVRAMDTHPFASIFATGIRYIDHCV
jgi:WD40 repeat protein